MAKNLLIALVLVSACKKQAAEPPAAQPAPAAVAAPGAAAAAAPAATWDGKSNLDCKGSQSLEFKDLKVDDTGVKIVGSLISASGDCQLKLTNCDIKSNDILSVNGNAQVTIDGGNYAGDTVLNAGGHGHSHVSIKGAHLAGRQAIWVGGDATVEVHDVKVEGQVFGSEKNLTGIAASR